MLKVILLFFFSISFAEASVPAPLSFDADVAMEGFSDDEQEKVRNAVEIIKKIVVSETFKERVLNHTYNGKKEFRDNGGYSNAEIYQKIIDGSEKLNPGANQRMDLVLELYHEKTNTIGYTYPNVSKIWINRKYFNHYTPEQVADNLIHEWMHKLGFEHDVKWNSERKHSVPYAIGYLVEELAKVKLASSDSTE